MGWPKTPAPRREIKISKCIQCWCSCWIQASLVARVPTGMKRTKYIPPSHITTGLSTSITGTWAILHSASDLWALSACYREGKDQRLTENSDTGGITVFLKAKVRIPAIGVISLVALKQAGTTALIMLAIFLLKSLESQEKRKGTKSMFCISKKHFSLWPVSQLIYFWLFPLFISKIIWRDSGKSNGYSRLSTAAGNFQFSISYVFCFIHILILRNYCSNVGFGRYTWCLKRNEICETRFWTR